MSNKQRLINRLYGRRVNLKRLAERISEPMAGRVLVRVTRLVELGEISQETYGTIVEAIKKEKPQIEPRVTYQTLGILRPPYAPPPTRLPIYYSSPPAPLDLILKGFGL